MENPNEISERFREVFLNGTWIANTNYKDLLSHMEWKEAIKKIGSLNTIATLTLHINYYVSGILNVFEGGGLEIRDKHSFEFPMIKSKQDWENIKNELFINSGKCAKHIERMSNKQLNQPFVDEKYGNYRRNIEGMIEHSYYHLGQISLLKKMIWESENK